MGRKVIWSRPALAQRQEIFEYWNKRNKSISFSKKLNSEFRAAMQSVAEMPGIGSFTDEAGILKKVVRAYILFYHFDEDHVFIDAVWDARRNPDKAPFYY